MDESLEGETVCLECVWAVEVEDVVVSFFYACSFCSAGYVKA